MPSGQSSVDEAIRAAIADKRLVSVELNGPPRIGEPHDYDLIKGVHKLFFYPVGGQRRSGPPVGFAGSRPAPSGRHAHWDQLIATISPRR